MGIFFDARMQREGFGADRGDPPRSMGSGRRLPCGAKLFAKQNYSNPAAMELFSQRAPLPTNPPLARVPAGLGNLTDFSQRKILRFIFS